MIINYGLIMSNDYGLVTTWMTELVCLVSPPPTLERKMMGDEILGAENRSENDPGRQDLSRGWRGHLMQYTGTVATGLIFSGRGYIFLSFHE